MQTFVHVQRVLYSFACVHMPKYYTCIGMRIYMHVYTIIHISYTYVDASFLCTQTCVQLCCADSCPQRGNRTHRFIDPTTSKICSKAKLKSHWYVLGVLIHDTSGMHSPSNYIVIHVSVCVPRLSSYAFTRVDIQHHA